MYKILICDDDQIILEGLTVWIEQAHPELTVVGYAVNGNVAKELVAQHKPDIIITDICMPYCNGLELIEFAKLSNPYVRAIIISGYDDFKFARKAVQLGALDFVLKPIDLDSLSSLLLRAVQDCTLDKSHHALQVSDILKSVIHNHQLTPENQQFLHSVNFPLSGYFQVIIVDSDHPYNQGEETNEEFQHQIYRDFNFVYESLSNLGLYTIFRNHSQFALCICAETTDIVQSFCKQAESLILLHRQKTMQSDLSLCKSHCVDAISDLFNAYEAARMAQQYKHIVDSHIVDYEQIVKEKYLYTNLTPTYWNDLSTLQVSVEDPLDEQFHRLSQSIQSSDDALCIMISMIYTNLSKELMDVGIRMSDIFSNPMQVLQEVLQKGTSKQMLAAFYDILSIIQRKLETNRKSKHSAAIATATEYLHKHYADFELSIEEVAKISHMSTNHFSTIFKWLRGFNPLIYKAF